jgi:hypothetical protein
MRPITTEELNELALSCATLIETQGKAADDIAKIMKIDTADKARVFLINCKLFEMGINLGIKIGQGDFDTPEDKPDASEQ